MHLLKSSGSEFINGFVLISRITTEATWINRNRGHHTESYQHFWNKMGHRWRMIYSSPDRSHVFSHLMTSVEFSFFLFWYMVMEAEIESLRREVADSAIQVCPNFAVQTDVLM